MTVYVYLFLMFEYVYIYINMYIYIYLYVYIQFIHITMIICFHIFTIFVNQSDGSVLCLGSALSPLGTVESSLKRRHAEATEQTN